MAWYPLLAHFQKTWKSLYKMSISDVYTNQQFPNVQRFLGFLKMSKQWIPGHFFSSHVAWEQEVNTPPPLTAVPNQRSYLTTRRHMWTSWSNYLYVSKASKLLTVSGFVEIHAHTSAANPTSGNSSTATTNQASLWSQQTSFRHKFLRE